MFPTTGKNISLKPEDQITCKISVLQFKTETDKACKARIELNKKDIDKS